MQAFSDVNIFIIQNQYTESWKWINSLIHLILSQGIYQAINSQLFLW